MSIFSSVSKSFKATVSFIKAGYDVANTTARNKNYYATAKNLSGDDVASPAVRSTLRNRARYEYRNNTYLQAMLNGRASDVVGRGARLQLNMPNDEQLAEKIERTWIGWSRAVNFAEKLKLAEKEVGVAGEAFLVLSNNPKINHPIKLDITLVEAERVTSTSNTAKLLNPKYIDGILFDDIGNPVSYDILNENPGSTLATDATASTTYKASMVYHWFDKDRPSLHRGVPAITPGLQLFGFLRRYTQSVVLASETAADNAYTLEASTTDAELITEGLPFETLPLEAGTMTVMPFGYKAAQMKPEQPTNNYPDFKRSLIVEIGRSFGLPAHVSLGDSSGYNYASGRLDKQEYYKLVIGRQTRVELTILDGIFFNHWLKEASLIPSLFSLSPLKAEEMRTFGVNEWYWDGSEHVDPVKEANAQDTRLLNRMTTYKAEYAKMGKDYREAFQQIAEENKLMDELGITVEDVQIDQTEVVDEEEK